MQRRVWKRKRRRERGDRRGRWWLDDMQTHGTRVSLCQDVNKMPQRKPQTGQYPALIIVSTKKESMHISCELYEYREGCLSTN